MSKKKVSIAAALAGVACAGAFCFLVNGFGIDSEFEVIHSDPSPIAHIETDDTVGAENVININTADKQELTELEGIGDKMADRIIEYRSSEGEFHQREDIMKVQGIGQSTFENIKDNICVE